MQKSPVPFDTDGLWRRTDRGRSVLFLQERFREIGIMDREVCRMYGTIREKIRCAAAMIFIAALILCAGCRKNDTGSVSSADPSFFQQISEFYYTYSSSVNPPQFQRYRFYTEEGKYMFYHEKREGNHWPLEEEDITDSGTKELTEGEWKEFCGLLEGGDIREREESVGTGDSGPFLYIYLKEDPSHSMEFRFASYDRQQAFEKYCKALKRKAK